MRMATVDDPANTSLYTGYAILKTLDLSPLFLAVLGFLSRLLDIINTYQYISSDCHPLKIPKIFQLIILVGLSWGGLASLIVSQTATVIFIISIPFSVPHVEVDEKPLFFAVVVTQLFLLIRLVYSSISTFTTNQDFNLLTGSIVPLLCMAFLMELWVEILFVVGLTLKRATEENAVDSLENSQPLQRSASKVLKVAKTKIIRRLL
ncbi:hypothetical protein BUE80_DR001131 [Diplocarpon rosae]|nr:hypothetical protein BUE80_DR001131 [Diplocarpon rosae]